MRSDCERLRSSAEPSMPATIRLTRRQVNRTLRELSKRWQTKAGSQSRRECVRLAPMDEALVLDRLAALEIETPSWGYGNSGTRFHVFPWPGAARNAYERIDDAALVHRLTGVLPVASRCTSRGTGSTTGPRSLRTRPSRASAIGAINPNLFGDDEYRLGCVLPSRRGRARDRRSTTAASASRSRRGRLDGDQPVAGRRHELPRPGRPRRAVPAPARWPRAALRAAAAGMRLLVEYKFFEPASTGRICPTGARRRSSAAGSGRRRRCSSTPATTRRGRTSSRSSPCCSRRDCSAASISTTASTPTTT